MAGLVARSVVCRVTSLVRKGAQHVPRSAPEPVGSNVAPYPIRSPATDESKGATVKRSLAVFGWPNPCMSGFLDRLLVSDRRYRAKRGCVTSARHWPSPDGAVRYSPGWSERSRRRRGERNPGYTERRPSSPEGADQTPRRCDQGSGRPPPLTRRPCPGLSHTGPFGATTSFRGSVASGPSAPSAPGAPEVC